MDGVKDKIKSPDDFYIYGCDRDVCDDYIGEYAENRI